MTEAEATEQMRLLARFEAGEPLPAEPENWVQRIQRRVIALNRPEEKNK